jgi:hypothetical protein
MIDNIEVQIYRLFLPILTKPNRECGRVGLDFTRWSGGMPFPTGRCARASSMTVEYRQYTRMAR